jgi:catechol 2,3-dioxygenase-like lactoylglutathione lyase family enzyme
MTNGMNKAHHIGIVAQDIQASEAWYVEHSGSERLHT